MSRKVIVSQTATRKLDQLFQYLNDNWSPKVKDDFVKKLDKAIELIKDQPEIFPESQKEVGLRKCVITKQTILFYRFDAKEIMVVTIFDSRQNPDQLKKDL